MRIFQNIVIAICLAGALIFALPWQSAIAAQSHARPTLLTFLEGHWTMVGDVMGKPVQYDMEASPTLEGAFTEVHMKDVQVPSQYEARVFIGVTEGSNVIAHWLDSFGAKYSIPHGTGTIEGNTITFKIPYPSGRMRNTLTYESAKHTWLWVIQAQQPDGSWTHFAKYTVRHNTAGR